MAKNDIACVILAGGKSSRMKIDKSLLPFNNQESLALFQYERMSKIFNEVYISCKNDKFGFTDKLIIETAEDYAPTFALEKILDTLEKPVFVIGVDIPFFSKEAIEKLILNYDSSLDGIITQSKEFLEPLCSIYSPSINSYIKEAIKENSHKLGKIIKQANCKIITFEDSNLFVNMNTPEDYQLALHQLEEKNV